MKLYVNMPAGEHYGWAVCGRNLIAELAKLRDVRYVPDDVYDGIKRTIQTEQFIKPITEQPNGNAFDYLQGIDNFNGKMKYKGSRNVGYMFFENEDIHDELLNQLKEYDIIATGSEWNSDVVRRHGFDNVVTIHQGVDCELFKPIPKKLLTDGFCIFSGGKMEFRKSQDIVAYVVGKMQKKYNDVYLLTSWSNIFTTKEESKENWAKALRYLDLEKTIITDVASQREIAQYIAETDIGIFPNRSEGGTNLVMMEYMACGKPVIANYSRGQKDVLHDDYALLVEGKDDIEMADLCYEALEYAYKNRGQLPGRGTIARETMKQFTWEKTAQRFAKLYE